MIDGTFVSELGERMEAPQQIGDHGLIALPKNWSLQDQQALIKPGPAAQKLEVYALGAIADYLAANRDQLTLADLVVHVVSPQVVRLLGPLRERARDRETYVEAVAVNLLDNFVGKFMSQEEFIIGLQTRFEDAFQRSVVLQLASAMTHEAVTTSADDGVGQTVTAKAGVALKATVPVPNPVKLRPFRTFREVQQPESLFVLRVNPSMQLGLFEADGGAWRLEAVARVVAWLKGKFPETSAAVLG